MRQDDRYSTWRGNRGKRLPKRFYPPGYPVHVVVCTHESTPHFRYQRLGDLTMNLIDSHPATYAACLMPDHLHWLLSGDWNFSRVVQRFKSYSTTLAWRTGHRGKLWQRSFFDHVVRKREGLHRVAEYIVTNPMRAGLVSDWRDYPYTSLYPERMGGS